MTVINPRQNGEQGPIGPEGPRGTAFEVAVVQADGTLLFHTSGISHVEKILGLGQYNVFFTSEQRWAICLIINGASNNLRIDSSGSGFLQITDHRKISIINPENATRDSNFTMYAKALK